ncbi:protein of unknown function [Micropruina glycogenica]|uniref:Uncharacterized protein n=1 Tax=Micropruina glycogenica TaxID=75385 RepID=A0A2N9JC62_9ACTN|nr:protein of unknown function [Micropruina glycogenica]
MGTVPITVQILVLVGNGDGSDYRSALVKSL